MTEASLPRFEEWSIAVVKLLQGVVYVDDQPAWNILLSNRSRIEGFVGRLGLQFVVEEVEGFAFLQQTDEDDLPEGYDRLPRLFRKSRMSYDATLLCVLLREELRRYEDEDTHNERCVVSTSELFEQWKAFFPAHQDEVRLRKALGTALSTLADELRFIRLVGKDPEEWEIRRVLKSRLSAAKLERLLGQLLAERDRRAGAADAKETDESPA